MTPPLDSRDVTLVVDRYELGPVGTNCYVVRAERAVPEAVVIDPGQALGDHQVHERSWIVVLDGTVRIASGGESVDAGAGFLAWLEAGERRSISTDDGARILLLLAPWPGQGHYHAAAERLA